LISALRPVNKQGTNLTKQIKKLSITECETFPKYIASKLWMQAKENTLS